MKFITLTCRQVGRLSSFLQACAGFSEFAKRPTKVWKFLEATFLGKLVALLVEVLKIMTART